ncbi:cytochrome P450 [Karstenula rhodostoma CBS 690.94]|uniref:Cytochrome P450 n=1 Tax=Karstenula rhodostoma CBS 690.94 TaxID=1392251 RepID=A0A9P4UAW5_9PLEO|nr:cytochrome P450 [Karstenula rhodostoma CBS 690.94]
MPHGHNWRRGRAALVSFLKDEELEKVRPIQQAESTQMVFEILQEPATFEKHVLRAFCSVILESVYGVRGTREMTDRFSEVQDEWTGVLDMGAMPPLDVFPWLRYVPSVLTPWPEWRKRSAELAKAQGGYYKELFERGRKNVGEGKAKESFLAKLLERKEKEGFRDIELVYIAGVLVEAGADTTAVASLIFILAMVAHPDVQRRAQVEVDGVFGERMPTNIDAAKLPYLQAILWEVLRWRPGFPISLPHATSKDDIYEGYFIPAGTTALMNTWAINHNEEDFPKADTFDPARWLVEDCSAPLPGYSSDSIFVSTEDSSRRRSYAFGAGRRVCVGQEMAERSLLLSMAKMLWAFDMRPEAGTMLDTNVETGFKDAVLTGPKESKIEFKVRSEARENLICKEWKSADAVLSKFG